MDNGYFIGEVVTTWLIDEGTRDRLMRLEADFEYVAPDGIRWIAPQARKINGASIPDIIWGPILGSPYCGDFRRASVIHDIACEDKPYTSDRAHLMFYYAMRCDGTAEWLAKIMYTAVKAFGPQWGNNRTALELSNANLNAFGRLVRSPGFDAATIEDVDPLLIMSFGQQLFLQGIEG